MTIKIKETLAKPVITTDDLDTVMRSEMEFDDKNNVNIVSAEDLTTPRHLAPGTPGGDLFMKELAFFEEPVTFMVLQSSDPNDEAIVPASVNCDTKYIERGKEYTLPRKFLNVLIARSTRVDTENYKDNKNLDQTRIVKTFSLKYTIQIIKDANPMGMKWFKWQCENA
jgi:hypothetical protein